jgi:hypothetical protein
MDCHDCILGTQQTLLNSPFDYTEEFAEEFASLTSSCGATQYSFTPPATYALGTQPSETPLPAPSCSQTYTVKAGDTCNSISTTFNVSTNAIVLGNGLLSDCSEWSFRECDAHKTQTHMNQAIWLRWELSVFLRHATFIRFSLVIPAIVSSQHAPTASVALNSWLGTPTSMPYART